MIVLTFILAIALLVLLISKLKLHPFLSLILVSMFMGLCGGMSPSDVISSISDGFGGIMGYIGIVIVCGVIIGEVLELTGAAQKIASSVLNFVGKKRAPLAANMTGAVVSIPVFCDSGFVILNPVIKAISRVGKIPYASLVIALAAGLLTTHAFVPPTPGPIAASAILGADLGHVMIFGLITTIPVSICVVIWASSPFIRNRFPDLAPFDAEDIKKEKSFESVVRQSPGTLMSYLPILVPIVLIVIQSFTTNILDQESYIAEFINFVGKPMVALIIGTGLAFLLPTRCNATVTDHWVSVALSKSAEVLLITAAGGAFGKVLQNSGVGDLLGEMVLNTGLPVVFVPFVIASLSLIAQGSATVALLSTAAIVKPMLDTLGLSPELAVIAIAAGSFTGLHSNGSYFWVVSKLAGFDLKQSYVAVTITTIIMGISALATVYVLSLFIS